MTTQTNSKPEIAPALTWEYRNGRFYPVGNSSVYVVKVKSLVNPIFKVVGLRVLQGRVFGFTASAKRAAEIALWLMEKGKAASI